MTGRIRVELFYSLSSPYCDEARKRVREISERYGFTVRETLATVHRLRAWRRGVRMVPTLQINGVTVWIGLPPEDVLERIFRELSAMRDDLRSGEDHR
jgi:AraC-like DNA-binding protein